MKMIKANLRKAPCKVEPTCAAVTQAGEVTFHDATPEAATARGDREKWAQILRELMDNYFVKQFAAAGLDQIEREGPCSPEKTCDAVEAAAVKPGDKAEQCEIAAEERDRGGVEEY